MNLEKKLANQQVHASVPCRIDFGGTLDISTLYLPLNRQCPSSVNMALDLRTHVTLSPYQSGRVKISSTGFEPAEFEQDRAPFNHPMGLMFFVAQYFDAHGVHIQIESTSPPKSALGGSSCAAVAMVSAFHHCLGIPIDPEAIAWLAHYLEAAVAGVPCGMQDQLAAAYGGVNQWTWDMGQTAPEFKRQSLVADQADVDQFNSHILVAYCGIPHVSKDINSRWVKSFISGQSRRSFQTIARITQHFFKALQMRDFRAAADLMSQETQTRLEMTPDVLDNTGKTLFETAKACGCGARFTGAGGGGCLWAIGERTDIEKLRPIWHTDLESIENAKILDTKIENKGIVIS
jgi:D-glycero-alpha-D-manno-heptose-7-phosphate kinase